MAPTLSASPAALAVAQEVAWRGHTSSLETLSSDLERHGRPVADVAEAVAEAIASGLLRQVPRLGGWTATRATNTRIFGRAFAEAWA